nr:serine protease grass-like [Drosophila kikkawai]
MKCLLLLVALIDLLFWHKGSASFLDEDCALIKSSDAEARESYRHRAEPGTTPWMAVVSNQHGFLCGGTLITKKFVLTAAHCIDGQDQLCRGVEIYKVTRASVHLDYNPSQGTNDIGLLELESEVQYKNHIQPICVVTDDAINVNNINVFTAFGWGQTQTGRASQLLMAVRLFRRDSEECHFEFRHQVRDNQICAGSARGDTCHGDSGGPLTTVVGERYIQVGIVSYGTGMCNASAIYTDVWSYIDWIVSNTWSVKLGVYHSSCATRSCRGVESYNVINAIIHIDYNPVDGTNDIGLLELHSEVRYNNHIRPICIVTDDAINIDNINVFTAFGWGKTETRQASEVLMAVRLFRRSSEECNFEFKHQVRENQICAGSAIGDTCEGDSGGPLAFYDGERYIQVGIVSYGTKMCNASAIYTDVSKYKDWIVTNTRKNRRGNINRY